MNKQVAVFGMGYVGCVSAACLSRDGHRVIGVDVDERKVDTIRNGKTPVAELGLAELIRDQVASGNLTATTDATAAVRATEIALVAVGTPSSGDGSVETTAVERVIQSIGESLRDSPQAYTVVVRSTLLPGILESRLAPLLEESSGRSLGDGISLCNNPEFLREATAIYDYDNPPFVLVGASEVNDADPVLELYEGVHAEKIVVDICTSTLVKYACNAFHALKIGFANEIGTLARAFGANGSEVMNLLCRDHRLNISPAYLRPGFAFGGSCLPKDVRALTRFAQQNAITVNLLDAILPSNAAHLQRAIKRIEASRKKKIGLVGLSFKAGTDDLRESPLVCLAETLLGRGFQLKVYDPGIRVGGLVGTNLAYVDEHLPHLSALLTDDFRELLDHAELLVLGSNIADELKWKTSYSGEVIDLRRDLVTHLPNDAKSQ